MIAYFRRALGALVIVSALAGRSDAQATAAPAGAKPVSVGSRVRIFAPSLRRDRYIGRIDSLEVSEIVLDTAGVRRKLGFEMGPVLVEQYRRVNIRTSAIDRIELSGGRTTKKATIKGMVVGALIGGALLGFGNLPQVNPKASDFFKSAPAGLVAGGVIGGIVGWSLGGEKWVPAELPR